jgi:hypothetical protein
VQALKRRASRRAAAADGGAPLVAGLARAPLPSEASYLLTLLEASNQGESRDGSTLPQTLEQLGDASLQAALDAFTAADTFRAGRLGRRGFCGMLGELYAAAGAAPLSHKEATQLFEQADRHCTGYVCFHQVRYLGIVPRDECASTRCCTPGRATPSPNPSPSPTLTPTPTPIVTPTLTLTLTRCCTPGRAYRQCATRRGRVRQSTPPRPRPRRRVRPHSRRWRAAWQWATSWAGCSCGGHSPS